MSNFNAVNKALNASVPSKATPVGEDKAYSYFNYDSYTSLVNLGANDTITTGILIPPGALVEEVVVVSPTNGGTISVGIVGALTKYSGALAAGATTTVKPLIRSGSSVEEIVLNSGGASATGLYKVVVKYVKY